MSSHREAPEISKDPVADSTDLYAFVSPDAPDTVTLIANYVPLQGPAGGPNFYEFGDDVLYEINIDNDNDGHVDISFKFSFNTVMEVGGTFLYNVGPISSLDSSSWNRRQFYSVTRVDWERRGRGRGRGERHARETVLATNLPCPPCNVGPRSTPNYPALADAAIQSLPGGGRVFAGQRAEGFYVDLGSIFDLGALRPFGNLHLLPLPATGGKDGTKGYNVHTIALQVPKSDLTRDGSMPTNVMDPRSVIGVWATASRQRGRVRREDGQNESAGGWGPVSRLRNPPINQGGIPPRQKDGWKSPGPH